MSRRRVFLSVALVASLGGAGLASVHVAQADPPRFSRHSRGELRHRPDDLVDAAERGRRARQLWAAEAVARGEAEVRMGRNGARVVQTPDGRWVEHGVQDVGHVLVIAVEFGTERPAGLTASDPVGPLHNAILEPDREVDNSTYWVSDFDQQHYRELLFGGATESVAGYYQEVSSGRYSLVGDVTDWVTLPKHESYYNNKGAYRMDELVRDWATAWYAREISRGKTHQEIVDYLGQFDQWWRGDTTGNPNRPDGVIDHLMIVHAGEGQEAGAPDWAIWSHRSFVGNVEIATTGLRIRDYTIQPENGAIGVFAHEYAHDLGLPDFYDTTTGGQENSTSFWTLMSSGSWLGRGEGTIGTTPGHMGAPEKLQLGWLDYTTVSPGGTRNLVLNPAALDADQAVFVNLPPAQGSTHYYLAENRQCVGYDEALCLGPYNWTNLETTPKLLETFSFEPGLLVWYVNSAQYDNNVTIHPGAGRALPVVANSTALFWPSGDPMRNRSQAWDATFKAPGETYRAFSHSREHKVDEVVSVETVTVPARPAVSLFDDSTAGAYYDTRNPWGSVRVGVTGTTIRVTSLDPVTKRMSIRVAPAGDDWEEPTPTPSTPAPTTPTSKPTSPTVGPPSSPGGKSTPTVTPPPVKSFTKAPKPRIRGSAKVGATLKVVAGAWSPKPKLTYQWYRGSAKITKATASKYKLKARDRGKRITVKVTGKKTGYRPTVRTAVKTRRVQ